ncbi:hypothetical protein TNCV_3183921 [Trichonephila clavipes]|nr:hypothetical protein TNCV_3183921 [Trichonephila clavipes]
MSRCPDQEFSLKRDPQCSLVPKQAWYSFIEPLQTVKEIYGGSCCMGPDWRSINQKGTAVLLAQPPDEYLSPDWSSVLAKRVKSNRFGGHPTEGRTELKPPDLTPLLAEG